MAVAECVNRCAQAMDLSSAADEGKDVQPHDAAIAILYNKLRPIISRCKPTIRCNNLSAGFYFSRNEERTLTLPTTIRNVAPRYQRPVYGRRLPAGSALFAGDKERSSIAERKMEELRYTATWWERASLK